MTPHEYTDAARFPLTTRAGLTARQQASIDARDLDELNAYRDDWNQLTRAQRDILAELEEKAAHRAGVLEQMAAATR